MEREKREKGEGLLSNVPPWVLPVGVGVVVLVVAAPVVGTVLGGMSDITEAQAAVVEAENRAAYADTGTGCIDMCNVAADRVFNQAQIWKARKRRRAFEDCANRCP